MHKQSKDKIEFRDNLSAQDLAQQFKRQQNQADKETFLHAMVAHYQHLDFPGFKSSNGILDYETMRDISQGLRNPDRDIQNEWRHKWGLKQVLPKGFLYPGAKPGQVLSPENYYTLDQYDIFVGLHWLRQHLPALQPQQTIRYFLMPVVLRFQFKPDRKPIIDKEFLEMAEKLKCLLNDSRSKAPQRVIIAGILNTDGNHYINYFCSLDPTSGQLSIFILDPSAEREKGSKEQRELEYANAIKCMLEGSFPKISCHSFSVTQQLLERDCAYLSLQNLEDVLIVGKVFELVEGELRFNVAGLRVNGNPGKAYDHSEKCYCYNPQLLALDLQVRQIWAHRFTGTAVARVIEAPIYMFKEKPTLDDAVGEVTRVDPYDYIKNITDQYNTDVLGQVRADLCQLLGSLRDEQGGLLMENRVQLYQNNFLLPTDREVAEYTRTLRPRIGVIRVQNNEYTLAELEDVFHSLESVVYDAILDILKPYHAQALIVGFEPYLRGYHWREVCDNWEIIFDDFFSAEKQQKIVKLLERKMFLEIQKSCREMYSEEIIDSFVDSKTNAVHKQILNHFHAVLERIEFSIEGDVNAFLSNLEQVLTRYFMQSTGLDKIANLDQIISLHRLISLPVHIHTSLETLCVSMLEKIDLPRLLAKISHESNLQRLCEFAPQYCCLSAESTTEKYGIFIRKLFENELRPAVARRIEELTAAPERLIEFPTQQIQRELFADELPLLDRLIVLPRQWRSRFDQIVNSTPELRATYDALSSLKEKNLEQLDQYFEIFIMRLLWREMEAFIARNKFDKVLSLLSADARDRDSLLWQEFSRQVLKQEAVAQCSPAIIKYFTQQFTRCLTQALDLPQRLCQSLLADLAGLEASVLSLRAALEERFEPIGLFVHQLGQHRESIESARNSMNIPAFEKTLGDRRLRALADLNHFVQIIGRWYEEGSVEPSHLTYCLRPFFCRLFKVNVQKKGVVVPLAIELEQLVTVDAQIKAALKPILRGGVACSLRVLPAQWQSNVPFLAQPGKINYAREQQLTFGLLISMIHVIDTDLYRNSGWGGYWGKCLKPLKNGLLELLADLPANASADDLLPAPKQERLKLLIDNVKGNKIPAFSNSVDTWPLVVMLNGLERLAAANVVPSNANMEEHILVK